MYLSALIFGLLGSVHCMVMCGPIAMVLPKGKHFFNQVSYNFGRITSYLIIGGIFGLIGKGMFLAGLQQTISILAGVLLILVYFGSKSYSGNIIGTTFLNKILTSIRKSIGSNLTANKWYSRYLVGLVNGFLPCGLVYMAAVAAISKGSPEGGMAYMFLFGLGTVPMMAGLSISKQFLKAKQRVSLYRLVPFFVVVVSTLFILRGMNLGVPYVSPKLSIEMEKGIVECE